MSCPIPPSALNQQSQMLQMARTLSLLVCLFHVTLADRVLNPLRTWSERPTRCHLFDSNQSEPLFPYHFLWFSCLANKYISHLHLCSGVFMDVCFSGKCCYLYILRSKLSENNSFYIMLVFVGYWLLQHQDATLERCDGGAGAYVLVVGPALRFCLRARRDYHHHSEYSMLECKKPPRVTSSSMEHFTQMHIFIL